MMITIEMACSINGLIATEDGNEDFLSYRGWEIMLEFLKEYDVLIWGRKTWDNILSWGEEYLNDLNVFDVPVVLAHGIYVSDSDIEILKNIRGGISHNPVSNCKLSSGICNVFWQFGQIPSL